MPQADEADFEKQTALTLATNPPSHIPVSCGSTLLPPPVASLVSFVAQSSSLTLRIGTAIGGLALSGARVSTLTGLELTRAAVETVLLGAGEDVVNTSTGRRGKAEAVSLLERSVGHAIGQACRRKY